MRSPVPTTQPAPPLRAALAAIVYRAGKAEDQSLIYSSWLQGYAQARAVADVPRATYYRGQHEVVERMLARAEVDIACLASDPRTILGYCVHDGPMLHWLYVKAPFRRAGLGAALLAMAGDIAEYTHATNSPGQRDWLREWIRRTLPRAVYNPYRLHETGATNGSTGTTARRTG